jgi:hypothetical protein
MNIFAAIKKSINSDLHTPLNHTIWLNDYKTYGQDSYVYTHKDILHELYRDYGLSVNDEKTLYEALSYADSIGELGKAYGCIFSETDDFRNIDFTTVNTYSDLSERVVDPEILAIIGNNERALKVLLNNQGVLSALYNNHTETAPALASSPYLLSAAQKSDFYALTSKGTVIYNNSTTSYQTHYTGKVFILGVSQNFSSSSSRYTYVNTLEGEISATNDETDGTSGLVYRVNKFADGANIQPYYDPSATGPGSYSPTSYMSYLKIT